MTYSKLLVIGLFVYLLSGCQNKDLNSDIPGYRLIWQDEFDHEGQVDSTKWSFESGFVRNEELQWYQPDNAFCEKGLLIIEGKQEQVINPSYDSTSSNWRKNRLVAPFTSSSINTKGKFSFQYGLMEVKAKINTSSGMWPAIWTLGIEKPWPANGEIDVMEFYRVLDQPVILANAAWKGVDRTNWDSERIPLSRFLDKDSSWTEQFHVWKMDWTKQYIRLYLDEELLNEIPLDSTLNSDGFNPFRQPHYVLLNLAIGSNGGDPSRSQWPGRYEIDYVRVYKREE